MNLCPYTHCTRRANCKGTDYLNCAIYLHYEDRRELIDESNEIFTREKNRLLEKLLKYGSLKGKKL